MSFEVNVVVLWNTLYMDAALAHLRRRGVETKPEDVAQGELRPLRDLEETDGLAGPSAA